MSESKTARASQVKVAVVEDKYPTPELKIEAMCKLRDAKLFVNRMDFVDALIADWNQRKMVVLRLEAAEARVGELILVIQGHESDKELLQEQLRKMLDGDVVRVQDITKLTQERDEARQELENIISGEKLPVEEAS